MTSNPLRLACLAICLQASCAQAQDAAAASRAQRDASNPLRMIIEASKLKPRQKAAEPELAPKAAPEKVGVRPPMVKAAAPSAVPVLAQTAPTDPAPSLALGAAVEPPRPAVSPPIEPVPPAAAETAPQGTPVDPPESLATASTTPAPDQTLPLAAPAAAPPTAAPQLALAAPSPPQPDPVNADVPAPAARVSLQLANYVEPVLPDRVRRRLQSEAAVVVKFTVNPDGSVADVAVRSSSDRALDPIALDAVSQWRYKPIAAAQPHAVELVFKTAN